MKGPIIIVDDDKEDQEIYAECIKAIGVTNPIVFFSSCRKALDYLSTTTEQPFIILSDINMTPMSGLQFKEIIQKDECLRTKGIPFVFISTNASAEVVQKAHMLSVQGFFKKPSDMREIESMLRVLFDYWHLCKHIANTQ